VLIQSVIPVLPDLPVAADPVGDAIEPGWLDPARARLRDA
jgi:hypothetical protein